MKRLFPVLLAAGSAFACESTVGPLPPLVNPRLGDEHRLNVQFAPGNLCSAESRDLRTARVVALSQYAVVLADVNNPEGGFTESHYQSLARTFDAEIWPVITGNFGSPRDIDGNGRVALFFTRAVNELVPAGQSWYVGGVSAARDLFPPGGSSRLGACPGSNYAELIYMPVPDPSGVINGVSRSRDSEMRIARGLMAHELQHLINASRRLYETAVVASDWNEAIWLNEGLSHVAEELMGYAVSDMSPRQNLGIESLIGNQERQNAFLIYMQSNFQWLAHYLQRPDTTSMIGRDGLATRGATWSFLRYASDRRGGTEKEAWLSLTTPGASGFANLARVYGSAADEWIGDWLVSLYTDDAIPGVNPRFQQLSWNGRSLYPDLRTVTGASYGRYPLNVRALAEGTATFVIPAASAGYARFAVAANARAEIRTRESAASCRGSGPTRTLAVGEIQALSETEAEAFCLDGGPAGAEFAAVLAFLADQGSRTVPVTASGVTPATSPPQPSLHPTAEAGPSGHHLWETTFRREELRELGALAGGQQPFSEAQKNAALAPITARLRVTLVRTR